MWSCFGWCSERIQGHCCPRLEVRGCPDRPQRKRPDWDLNRVSAPSKLLWDLLETKLSLFSWGTKWTKSEFNLLLRSHGALLCLPSLYELYLLCSSLHRCLRWRGSPQTHYPSGCVVLRYSHLTSCNETPSASRGEWETIKIDNVHGECGKCEPR